MSIVIIAEKPSVANDLANVLNVKDKKETHWQSENLIITWAVGHLLELKSPDEYSMLQKIEENINIFSRRSLSDLSK